jgi:hypothetical protein
MKVKPMPNRGSIFITGPIILTPNSILLTLSNYETVKVQFLAKTKRNLKPSFLA